MKSSLIRQLPRRRIHSIYCRALSLEREVPQEGFLHRTGEHPYGSRKYHWVRKASSDSEDNDPASLLPGPKGLDLQVVATLCANRNIVFGASVVVQEESVVAATPVRFCTIVSPLLQSALTDCSSVGEQPQAVSSLHGLSSYVRKCLNGEIASEYMLRIDSAVSNQADDSSNSVMEAVEAIATGIPRPGHSVVGMGTHKVAAEAWEALAKEFILSEEHNTSDESRLYQQQNGAQLAGIELLADTSPAYVQSTGGAMARFFFV